MAATETAAPMSEEGRALLTDAERQILSGEKEVKDNYRYKVESLVRKRINEKFRTDVEILREHYPEFFAAIKEEVCDDEHPE